MELFAALVVFLSVATWTFARRRRTNPFGPLPEVGDAPPGAEPLGSWRAADDGLWTYWLDLPVADRSKPSAEPRTS
jgi:hypothetical protein